MSSKTSEGRMSNIGCTRCVGVVSINRCSFVSKWSRDGVADWGSSDNGCSGIGDSSWGEEFRIVGDASVIFSHT